MWIRHRTMFRSCPGCHGGTGRHGLQAVIPRKATARSKDRGTRTVPLDKQMRRPCPVLTHNPQPKGEDMGPRPCSHALGRTDILVCHPLGRTDILVCQWPTGPSPRRSRPTVERQAGMPGQAIRCISTMKRQAPRRRTARSRALVPSNPSDPGSGTFVRGSLRTTSHTVSCNAVMSPASSLGSSRSHP